MLSLNISVNLVLTSGLFNISRKSFAEILTILGDNRVIEKQN